jgi:TonB family protein
MRRVQSNHLTVAISMLCAVVGHAHAQSDRPILISPGSLPPGVVGPTLVQTPSLFPPIAARCNITGTVELEITISSNGKVTDEKVTSSSGYVALDQAAVEEARESLYTPATRNGEKIAVRELKTINFQLVGPASDVKCTLPPSAYTNGVPPSPQSTSTSAMPLESTTLTNYDHDCSYGFYPPFAIIHKQEGTTTVGFDVTRSGTVENIAVKSSSGYDSLDAAAIACVKTWKYHPVMSSDVAVASRKTVAINWKVDDQGFVNTPFTLDTKEVDYGIPPPPAPPDWQGDKMIGTVAAYKKVSGLFSPDQRLWAFIEHGYSDLDDFVARYGSDLKGGPDFQLQSEKRTTVCGTEPAWEIEFARRGLDLTHPRDLINVSLVAVFVDGFAFVATYERLAGRPENPDATQWIHSYCNNPSPGLGGAQTVQPPSTATAAPVAPLEPPYPSSVTPAAGIPGGHCDPSYYPASPTPLGDVQPTIVSFIVTVDGTVRDIKLVQSSGNVHLDNSATTCIGQWRYHPATQDGKPVEVAKKILIEWALKK